MDGTAMAIALACALTYFAGVGAVKGTKAVIHGVKHAIVKIVHPHRHDGDPKP